MFGEHLWCRNIGKEPLVDLGPVDNRNSGSGPVSGDWHNNVTGVLPDGPQLLVDQHQFSLLLASPGLSPTEHIVRTNVVDGLDKAGDEEITYIVTLLLQ